MIAIAERKILRLTVMTALYVAQGIPYGFITVTLAAYLAKHGATEGDIGDLTAFAMLPWSFKWLWAPLVDRFSHSRMGRRRPWIILAQAALVTMSSALIFIPDVSAELDTVRWMVFTANVFASLQDVSVDALAVDLLPEKERGFANGLMYGGSYLGVIFGGAVLSTIAGREGLSSAMITQGLVLGGIALLPLLLRERTTDSWFSLRARPQPADRPRSNLFKQLARAFRRRSPLLAAVLAVGILLASQTLTAVLTVLLMKKLGWEQEEFGQMTGGLPLIFALGLDRRWLARRQDRSQEDGRDRVGRARHRVPGVRAQRGLLARQDLHPRLHVRARGLLRHAERRAVRVADGRVVAGGGGLAVHRVHGAAQPRAHARLQARRSADRFARHEWNVSHPRDLAARGDRAAAADRS
ncbi:MAG: MFS transporter [Deltaproteobacteria bacterium]|nr:MFS transporter [Deltaproteobacteria bacterium]